MQRRDDDDDDDDDVTVLITKFYFICVYYSKLFYTVYLHFTLQYIVSIHKYKRHLVIFKPLPIVY